MLRRRELLIAQEAVTAATKVILTARKRIEQSPSRLASARNFLSALAIDTERDAGQAMISVIRRAFPRDEILSKREAECMAGKTTRRWIINPIDNALFALTGIDDRIPCSMVALEGLEGRLLISVAHFPFSKNQYHAISGSGAFLNGKRIRVAKNRCLADIVVGLNTDNNTTCESEAFRRASDGLRKKDGPISTQTGPRNSAMGIWCVSPFLQLRFFGAHIYDFNTGMAKQYTWEIAPVLLIIREAGGVVFNLRGQWVDHRRPEFAVVAESEQIAEEILRLAQ